MEETTISSKLFSILGIVVVIGMTVFVGYVQVQHCKQTVDYCNNKYGVNGWEFNETTGKGVNKHYIGQVWECVPLSNSSLDNSESQTNFEGD